MRRCMKQSALQLTVPPHQLPPALSVDVWSSCVGLMMFQNPKTGVEASRPQSKGTVNDKKPEQSVKSF